jgi:hypothetical protein
VNAQKLLTLIACLSLPLGMRPCVAQQSGSADLVKRIERGSPEAMLEAGKRAATDLVPLLKKHLNDADDPDRESRPGHWQAREAAHLALAKLGDPSEEQKIGCELFYGNPAEQSTAFYKVEYVGGWFEISRLAHFLPDTQENSSQMMPEPGIPDGDATIGTRQYLAVEALDRMSLVEPAALLSKEDPFLSAPKRAREWQHYIDAHQQELAKILPTGESAVESDNYCESYLASLRNRPDSYRVVKVEGEIRIISVEQRGFGTQQGNATFNGSNVPVREWRDNKVTVELPSHVPGQLVIVKSNLKVVPVTIR